MIVLPTKAFLKDAKRLSPEAYKRVAQALKTIANAENLQELSNCNKLQGSSDCYRLRVGDYRIGLILRDPNTVIAERVGHRREFYRTFP